ncbi:MAG: hypothetical protein WKF78_11615 [Candidatus Limnocylindrales bacterium]
MTRTSATPFAGRSSSMRRMRRRSSTASSVSRPYCQTNGCTSYLELDPTRGLAFCPICGFTRHTN